MLFAANSILSVFIFFILLYIYLNYFKNKISKTTPKSHNISYKLFLFFFGIFLYNTIDISFHTLRYGVANSTKHLYLCDLKSFYNVCNMCKNEGLISDRENAALKLCGSDDMFYEHLILLQTRVYKNLDIKKSVNKNMVRCRHNFIETYKDICDSIKKYNLDSI